MQPNHHDRPVNEKSDRDQRGHIDPVRSATIESIDHQTRQRERHKQNRRRGPPRLEYAVGNPTAEQGSGYPRQLKRRPRPAGFLEIEALRRLQIGRYPVHHPVAHEIHKRVRNRDRPEKFIAQHVAHKNFLEGKRALVFGRVVRRVVFFILLDRRQPAALRGVAQEKQNQSRHPGRDRRIKIKRRPPMTKPHHRPRGEHRNQRPTDIVRDVPRRDDFAALLGAPPVHHRFPARRPAHAVEPTVERLQRDDQR